MPLERQLIEESFKKLTDHVFAERQALPLLHDYYWNIADGGEAFSLDTEPRATLGQLSEDQAFLQKMVDDPDYMVGLGLVRLGNLLIALGRENAA